MLFRGRNTEQPSKINRLLASLSLLGAHLLAGPQAFFARLLEMR
jgi:hypothetical protein